MTNEQIDFGESRYPDTVTLKTVGEEIQGFIVEIGEVPLETRNAGFLHIETSEGVRTFWLGKVLTEVCKKRDLKVGDFIGVKFLGEVDSGKQSPYKNYDVRIIRQTLLTEIDTGGLED